MGDAAAQEFGDQALDDVQACYMTIMGKVSESLYHAGLQANRILMATAELVIGWLLIRHAEVALQRGDPKNPLWGRYHSALGSLHLQRFELAEARRRHPDTVRLLLTGYADMESTVAAINAGQIARYISKPWNDQDVVLTVREALERKALEREKARLEALTRSQNEELKSLNASLEEKVEARTGLTRKHLRLRVTPEARALLAALGYDPTRGARPLKRVIEERVVTPIAAILAAPEAGGAGSVPLDGFVGPAHVSTVIGSRPYAAFAAEYRKPVVIAGFEPLDVMQAIRMLVRQVNEGRAEVENEFTRAVTEEGNLKAQALMAEWDHAVRQACAP